MNVGLRRRIRRCAAFDDLGVLDGARGGYRESVGPVEAFLAAVGERQDALSVGDDGCRSRGPEDHHPQTPGRLRRTALFDARFDRSIARSVPAILGARRLGAKPQPS